MTHTPPSEYLNDATLFAAFRAEAQEAEWTTLHELLAVNVEVTHAVLRQSQLNAGAKEMDVGPPLRIPRPGDEPTRVGALAMARMMGGGASDE